MLVLLVVSEREKRGFELSDQVLFGGEFSGACSGGSPKLVEAFLGSRVSGHEGNKPFRQLARIRRRDERNVLARHPARPAGIGGDDRRTFTDRFLNGDGLPFPRACLDHHVRLAHKSAGVLHTPKELHGKRMFLDELLEARAFRPLAGDLYAKRSRILLFHEPHCFTQACEVFLRSKARDTQNLEDIAVARSQRSNTRGAGSGNERPLNRARTTRARGIGEIRRDREYKITTA